MTPEQRQRHIARAAAKVRKIERALDIADADLAFLKAARAQGASNADIEAARLILRRPRPIWECQAVRS